VVEELDLLDISQAKAILSYLQRGRSD
jgi:hypothetical protein